MKNGEAQGLNTDWFDFFFLQVNVVYDSRAASDLQEEPSLEKLTYKQQIKLYSIIEFIQRVARLKTKWTMNKGGITWQEGCLCEKNGRKNQWLMKINYQFERN